MIVLTSMPFSGLYRPPIGIGSLTAKLREASLPAVSMSLNCRLAEAIGEDMYNCAIGSADDPRRNVAYDAFLGEFAFASFDSNSRQDEADKYISWVINEGLSANRSHVEDLLSDLWEVVPKFLDDCVKSILEKRPTIVGFSCTFQQVLPSLALARRLKKEISPPKILFGGPSMAGEMGREWFAKFPEIDAVCLGEADYSIAEFVCDELSGGSRSVQGFLRRIDSETIVDGGEALPVQDMENLPPPDFDDHFVDLPPEVRAKTRLQYEGSRGCWWGQKHHCTFCGQNAEGLQFRQKSAKKVENEIRNLSRKYEIRLVEFCDNILSHQHQRTLIPNLARKWPPLKLFFEIKSNQSRESLRILSQAGVGEVQPGIESLSTAQLSRMRKGVSGLQNICFLKWCKVYGITAYWNILWGFPGEGIDDYRDVEAILRKISHLEPPQNCGYIRIDRFSPFFFESRDLGIDELAPHEAYRFILPDLPEASVFRIAYHFDVRKYLRPDAVLPRERIIEMSDHCDKWRELGASGAELKLLCEEDEFFLSDKRIGYSQAITKIPLAEALALCEMDKPCRVDGFDAGVIHTFVERDLVHIEGQLVVSLVEIADQVIRRVQQQEIEGHGRRSQANCGDRQGYRSGEAIYPR